MRMRLLLITLFVAFISCNTQKPVQVEDLTKYVDPQIGSVHGRWFFYTPAAVPFGMAKLAPHTNAYNSKGSWGPVGYDDRHASIEGFGHFHEFQVGGVVFMPTTGELKTVPGSLENPDEGYRSRFDKDSEHAETGYYSVVLKDYMIKAEITATTRVGYHRYTFPETGSAHLIVDVGHKQGESSDVTEAYAKLINGNEIEGYVITYPEYAKFCDEGKRVRMYFVSRMSKKPSSFGSFVDDVQKQDVSSTKGVGNGLYLNFDMNEGEALEIQTGVSYTSIENARLNLNSESKGKSFDVVRADAKKMWQERLSKIVVEGGREEDRVKFYTGLYHALLGRGISSDINGQYQLVD
jgi:predicted alpha-1,2-mannosidase